MNTSARVKTSQPKVPQYQWLAEQLRGHIRAGALQHGDRLPSWAEMQREYGVNKYTIERAQKMLADEGLLVTVQGSGTFVTDAKANAKLLARSGILGLCGAGFSASATASLYWAAVVHGIQEAAREANQHILTLDYQSTNGWEKADGILLSDQSAKNLVSQIPPGQPCVSLLNDIDGVCSVFADEASGIEDATRHLLELGHRRIAYFHGEGGPIVERRIDAFRATLNAAGIRPRREWTRPLHGLARHLYKYDYGARFVETGRENMRQWLREGWAKGGCTALLAHNDDFAMGVVEALAEAGIRVPEDVSVVGFDGVENAAHFSPPLTTIEVPLEEIGRRAVGLLLQQIQADETNDQKHRLPATLRVRASTAAPANS